MRPRVFPIFWSLPRFLKSCIPPQFFIFVFCGWTLGGIPPGVSGETAQYPYKAQVIKDGAYVRSGPGQEYYPTDALKAGQVVEVYRHDPGGWYAIRPPEGSFSWVLTRQVEISSDGLARAKQDQVAVVVGSRLKNLQDVVQVYLKQGETVELVEEHSGQNPIKEIWCKIAPPSGEFRWISAQDVRPLTEASPAEGGSADAASGQVAGGGSAPQTPTEAPNTQGSPPSATNVSPPASVPASPTGSSPENNVPLGVSGNAPPAASAGAVAIPPGSTGLAVEEFRQKLNQLELELAGRVVAEPSGWQLQDLAGRAELLLGQAPDAPSRSEARELLSRISRFMEVQRQYGQIALAGRSGITPPQASPPATTNPSIAASGRAASGDTVQASSPGVGQTAPTVPSEANPAGSSAAAHQAHPPGEDDRFDGIGRLSRVVSAKPGAPTYALLNEQGEVVCYVTPAPGINLRPFEGKWIGVSGVAGLMLQPRAKHVAVKQVAVLDSPTRVLR